MNQQEVRAFVEAFFTIKECRFLEKKTQYITVEINGETDRDLGNRPFYWSYIDKMGIEPQLLSQTFIFDPSGLDDSLKGEVISFGSNRLHQIFNATKKRGKYIRLFEELHLQKGTNALYPWLLINYKIEYICDQKKEQLLSFGLNLVTGELWPNFYDIVQRLRLTPKLPAYVFVQPPLFSKEEALKKLEAEIENIISQEDFTWAKKAEEKYLIEKEQTLHYFEELRSKYDRGNDKKREREEDLKKWEMERKLRLEELAWQYKPRIEIKTINQGLIYLRTHPTQVSIHHPLPNLYEI